ncbi:MULTISPECIES: hypothetical protein [unclassified Nonomuraea]|uniref:hypothetical protein n=1 Tax=unclassified Nonomuraea TaxID=2593643 RepID=UPI0035BF30DC
MKNIKSLAAGALTAAAVLAPTAVAQADTPYAQASVRVASDGRTVGAALNVISTSRLRTGIYCVNLNENVMLRGPEAIHATPVGVYPAPRWLSIINAKECGKPDRGVTIAVRSINPEGQTRDVAFYFSVS